MIEVLRPTHLKILGIIALTPGPFPVEAICREIGLPSPTVWDCIRDLLEAGLLGTIRATCTARVI